MAKYRGKHNGQTRGKYQYKKLEYNDFPNSNEHRELTLEIQGYLATLGAKITESYRDANNTVFYNACYHIGGASVGLESLWNYDCDSQKHVRVVMVTNSGLDDIVEKITDEFPVFKEQKYRDARNRI